MELDKVSNSLYHYTDIGALASIVKNKKLWLSNAAFQNDTQEMLEGFSFLKKMLDGYKSDPKLSAHDNCFWYLMGVIGHVDYSKYSHHVFTCSFSRAPDLLSQWRAYGSFAIEFSRDVLGKQYALYDCVYGSAQKDERIYELINGFFMANDPFSDDIEAMSEALAPLVIALATFKSEHFEAEHEVRLIESGGGEVLHRPRKDFLVPYVELSFQLDCIKSLHIGPVANPDLTEASLNSLLRSSGLGHIPIIKSAIPYRS